MNEDFIFDLTPATARKLIVAKNLGRVDVDESIIEIAQRDMLTRESFDIDISDQCLDLIQFIVDYNHRVVIPFDFGIDDIANAIVMSTPGQKILIDVGTISSLFSTFEQIGEPVSKYHRDNQDRIQLVDFDLLSIDEIIMLRDRTLILNTLTAENSNAYSGWLGRLFPRIIICCRMSIQYSFQLGGKASHASTAICAAQILYPKVSKYATTFMRLLGVYDGMIDKQPTHHVKKKSNIDNLTRLL